MPPHHHPPPICREQSLDLDSFLTEFGLWEGDEAAAGVLLEKGGCVDAIALVPQPQSPSASGGERRGAQSGRSSESDDDALIDLDEFIAECEGLEGASEVPRFPPPQTDTASRGVKRAAEAESEEDERRREKLERNRKSAALSRQRKRSKLDHMSQRVRELERWNASLAHMAATMQAENAALRARLAEGQGLDHNEGDGERGPIQPAATAPTVQTRHTASLSQRTRPRSHSQGYIIHQFLIAFLFQSWAGQTLLRDPAPPRAGGGKDTLTASVPLLRSGVVRSSVREMRYAARARGRRRRWRRFVCI